MKGTSVVLVYALVSLGLLVSVADAACVSDGDQNTINKLFSSGGANTVVQLCAGVTISVTGPVECTAPNQEISTEGYPTGATRATLLATNDVSTVITGSTAQCLGFKIRNIQVNGNRPKLGRLANGGANIDIGGRANNQLVEYTHSFDPRGWSALHIIEGGCTGAVIQNNDIGPSGSDKNAWADGISLACMASLVQNNVVTDATDGGIVVFGAPGSKIINNHVISLTQTMLGGINLVDYTPYNGNYTGTIITGNTIEARSAFIKTGIAGGPFVWSNADEYNGTNFGATITNNHLTGDNFGFGIVAAGVKLWTVSDNDSTAKYGGAPGACPTPPNAAPTAFLKDPATSSGRFQAGFVDGHVKNLLCNNPGFGDAYSYSPGQLALTNNQQITLANGRLLLQSSGNLVLSDNSGKTLWQSGTSGLSCTPTCTFTFDAKGDAIIKDGAGNVKATYPPNYPTDLGLSSLTISDKLPYLLMFDGTGNTVWGTTYDFYQFWQLKTGQWIRQEVDAGKVLFLALAHDANIVVYSGSVGGTVVWSTNLTGKTCNKGCNLLFQGDYNLVLTADQGPVWATGVTTARRVRFNGAAPYLQEFDANDNVVYSSK